MKNLGVQISETDAKTDFSYLVTQIEKDLVSGEYKATGGIIWVDKSQPNPDTRLLAAIADCLAARFGGHRRK